MTVTTRGSTVARSTAHARRHRIRLPRASTTPGQVRLILAGLVIVSLAWGLSRRLAGYR